MYQIKNKKIKTRNIAISANFNIEPIEPILSFWIKKCNLPIVFKFGPYNQIFQELLDPSSQFSFNDNVINVLFIKFDNLFISDDYFHNFREIDENTFIDRLGNNAKEILNAISIFSKKSETPIVIVICPPSLFHLDNVVIKQFLEKLERQFIESIDSINGTFCLSYSDILKMYPVDEYYEELGDQLAHIPYTESFFISLGTMVFRTIFNILSVPYKVIAVDCDNTIWTGVVGEDGVYGIKIDERCKYIQEFLLDQYNAGMLICLCSKNNEKDVEHVFINNNEMLLKKHHLSNLKINWIPKSQNLLSLSKEMNLGIDSFIFIDDSPVECEEVRINCPEVLTIQLPDKNDDLKKTFQHLWVFDHLKITSEDKNRTKFYQCDRERDRLLKNTPDYATFINNLDLNISIRELDDQSLTRASQLTQRVNQFNLSTIRRTESEIKQLKNNVDYDCFVVYLSDKFGEYGLVGLIIGRNNFNYYNIDTFLLSCRALGRGVEYSMLAHAGARADELQIENVRLYCKTTSKNAPIREFVNNVCNHSVQNKNGNLFCTLSSKNLKNISFTEFLCCKHNVNADYSIESPIGVNSQKTNIDKLRQNNLIEISSKYTNVQQIKEAILPNKRMKYNGKLDDIDQKDTRNKLHDVWCEVLNHEDINFTDKFFDIGGKSIHIPLMVIKLQKKFDIRISLIDIFQYPSIDDLSKFIDNKYSEQFVTKKH